MQSDCYISSSGTSLSLSALCQSWQKQEVKNVREKTGSPSSLRPDKNTWDLTIIEYVDDLAERTSPHNVVNSGEADASAPGRITHGLWLPG